MIKRAVVIVLASLLLLFSAILLNRNPIETLGIPAVQPSDQAAADILPADDTGSGGKVQLTFSESGHFFSETVDVAIFASVSGAVIHYTTDGTDPTSDSEEYTEPLRFESLKTMQVITLKAIAVHGDTVTRPAAHTFFVGQGIDQRFDTLVFSLSTNPEYLYDYDTGILVAGRERDEYIKDNPGANIIPTDPANYNWRGMEGERPVYVEVFTPEGERVIAQAAGIRVNGGWSRSNDQKSLRLVARKEYEPSAGKFHFDFFPEDSISDGYGSPLIEYDTIVLRDGANDRNFGMLRNELGSLLALEAGLRVTSPARAAAVFVNGEYYGFAWIQVRINEQYLQDIYSAPTQDFEVIGNGEQWLESDNTAALMDLEYLNSFANKNLSDDAVFRELESIVDIGNLLLYYAVEIYLGNDDWPGNNMKRWRYTGPQVDGLAPELDGRWRYAVYDLDWILDLYNNNSTDRTFQNVMGSGEKQSPMLKSLLKRPDMADRFTMILCDLAANIVTEENVRETVEKLYSEAESEINTAISDYKYDGWVSEYSVQDNHASMINYTKNRSAYILKSLRDYFGYADDMFEVSVTGGEAVIGTQQGASARYFSHLTVPLSPVLPRYTVFDHWIVNGVDVYEPDITVSSADARGGVVSVELVTREELPALVFSEAHASTESSGCTLVNPNGQTVRTDGLFVSNDPQNLQKWALPAASVKPGEALTLAGKGSADTGDLFKIKMGFNVKQGRLLILSDETGRVLDTVAVP